VASTDEVTAPTTATDGKVSAVLATIDIDDHVIVDRNIHPDTLHLGIEAMHRSLHRERHHNHTYDRPEGGLR
jgi:hypothetical protein